VSCPRNNIYFAGSQLAVFQGANERPYLNHTGRESNAEKRPTGSGPEGCDENGPATALLVAHVPHHFDTGGKEPDLRQRKMVRDAPLLAPCRRPILIATKYMLFRGQDTIILEKQNWFADESGFFCIRTLIIRRFCFSRILSGREMSCSTQRAPACL
jgi:hypothetical protein